MWTLGVGGSPFDEGLDSVGEARLRRGGAFGELPFSLLGSESDLLRRLSSSSAVCAAASAEVTSGALPECLRWRSD